MPINNNILNQKGTPAFYSDIFANRPAFGYAGRVFISTDTGAIYEDTGSAWTLIADAGAGTTGTLQQVTTNGNTTTLGIQVQGIDINDGAGTGANNIAIGNNSLSVNTTGNFNLAIGQGVLAFNTIGINNSAFGYASLGSNTTGNNNTAYGFQALNLNGIGNNNTAIGSNCLTANTSGVNNTAIGYFAGQLITTGSNNTILGNYGGTSTLASNIVLSDGAGNVRLFSDANGLIGINQAVGSTIGGQLDIHSTQTYALVLNGLSTSNAYTAFSNASVGKWRIGNTYNAGANSFDIFNLGTSSTALSFNSTTNVATFTGALSGTSATFSGLNQFLDNTVATTSGKWIRFTSTGSDFIFGINNSTGTSPFGVGGNYSAVIGTNNATNLVLLTNGVVRQTIASTGAATFSSSVTATQGNFTATANTYGGGALRLTSFTGGTNVYLTSNSGFFVLSNGGTADHFLIDSTGAATFSSSVTAAAFIPSGATVPTNGMYLSAANTLNFATNTTNRLSITSTGVINATSRANFLGSTDNALFSLNSGGTLYTVGFSPNATASSTNTLTLTTAQTTWIYTGTGLATWTLPTPSGTNQMFWIKNAGTGIITLNAFAGTNIIDNSATSVSSITIAVGATVLIQQDGNVKSYQLQ